MRILIVAGSPKIALFFGRQEREPSMAIGNTGTPVLIASWKAPVVKTRMFPSADRVPSGKNITGQPS